MTVEQISEIEERKKYREFLAQEAKKRHEELTRQISESVIKKFGAEAHREKIKAMKARFLGAKD